jgi:glycine hydroxymethyltransferase
MTTRGFKEAEAKLLAGWIADILDDIDNEDTIKRVKADVVELCKAFPVYAD